MGAITPDSEQVEIVGTVAGPSGPVEIGAQVWPSILVDADKEPNQTPAGSYRVRFAFPGSLDISPGTRIKLTGSYVETRQGPVLTGGWQTGLGMVWEVLDLPLSDHGARDKALRECWEPFGVDTGTLYLRRCRFGLTAQPSVTESPTPN